MQGIGKERGGLPFNPNEMIIFTWISREQSRNKMNAFCFKNVQGFENLREGEGAKKKKLENRQRG